MSQPPPMPPSRDPNPAPPPLPASSTQGKSGVPIAVTIGLGCLLLYSLFKGGDDKRGDGTGTSGPGGSQPVSEMQSSQPGNSLGLGAVLSRFNHAGGSACVIGPDGAWHAVFQEWETHGSPMLIYHTTSRDGGQSWTTPQDLTNDDSGNGAGFPQMAMDAQGRIFAAWIRFGEQGRVIAQPTLDGPGGYVAGTLTVRQWTGSGWSQPRVMGTPEKIISFCLVQALDGSLQVVWEERGCAILQGSAAGGGTTVLAPEGAIPGAYNDPSYNRLRNIAAVQLRDGGMVVTAERKFENQQQLVMWHGGRFQVLYSDPASYNRNTFNHPAQIFADASGRLHVIYIPHPKDAGREEVRDLDPMTGQQVVIFAGSAGNPIPSFQLVAAGGRAHVAVQMGAPPGSTSSATDVGAVSFDGTTWSAPRMLTGVARGQSYSHTDLPGGDVASGQRYYASHASMALDRSGRVHALTTINAVSIISSGSQETVGGKDYNVVFGGSMSEPALFVLPWNE